MASELEEPAEPAHDLIREELAEAEKDGSLPWLEKVALVTMIMALLSALGALAAAFSANELMLDRTEEILESSEASNATLEIELLSSKHEILESLGESPDPEELERVREFQARAREAKSSATQSEASVQKTLPEHERFAIGVSLLSIAITLSGMSIVTTSRRLWFLSLTLGLFGAALLAVGFFKMIS